MPRARTIWRPLALTALALAGATACQSAGAGPGRAAPAQRTVRDGVYTEMQARYGAGVFNGSCAKCHSTSEWRNDGFLRSWSGKTLNDLFVRIYETMPRGAPGSLSPQEYADVIAYMLHLNGLPTGGAELSTQDAELRGITIEPPATP